MPTQRCNLRFIVACLGLAMTALAQANSRQTQVVAPEQVIEAIWRVERLDFEYRSFSTFYACGALQDKISAILQVVGARRGVTVEIPCAPGQILSGARARITLAVPVEATAENVRAATTFDSRDELVARMHKLKLPTATDLQRFPATWHTVSLTRDRQLRLDAGDCELLNEMREQLFPKLAIRVTRDGMNCMRSATRMRPTLEVAALVPVQVVPVAYVDK